MKRFVTLKDFAGKEIKPGDFIAYGMMAGDSARLNIGLVLETYTQPLYDWSPEGKQVERISILTNHEWSKEIEERETIKCKKSTLQYSDRLIVISPSNLGNSDLARFLLSESKKIKKKLAAN